jgi:CBS domain-containing protein
MQQRTVRDLLRLQDVSRFPAVSPSSSLEEALEQIRDFESGAALVLESGHVRGIISERDFARVALERGAPLNLNEPVSHLMSRRVVYVTEDYSAEQCLAVMSELNIRHLPVLRGDTPVALLNVIQLAKILIEDREYLIDELVKYITGSNTCSEKTQGSPVIRELELN